MRLLLFVFTIILACKEIISERLNKQIYSSIEGGAACFRRLNGTHQVGCSSSERGAVGAVHMIRDVNDVLWLVHNSTAGPYIAVVNTVLFRDVILMLIAQPDNVAGVLLYDNATMRPAAFSQESRCPNEYSASPGSHCTSSQVEQIAWNDKGTGLLRENIPFPILYLPHSRTEEIVKIEDCYNRFNLDKNNQKGQPLCSIQLNSFMFAVLNSEVCLRRSAASPLFSTTKVCDPLGDFNVYFSLFSRGRENTTVVGGTANKNKPVILVTARIDAASLFDGVAPGAAGSVVGIVTLIMAAANLAQMIPQKDAHLYEKNVLWTLFNGETFDYIGSQRVAYDIKNGTWPPLSPLEPSDINLHVELGQIGGSILKYKNTPSWPIYAFAPYDAINRPLIVKEFLEELSRNYGTNISVFGPNMPPSSIHSFRRILSNATNTASLPEATLLVDHEESFTNMFYESVLDDSDNIGFVYHNISIGVNGTFLSTDWLIANGTMSAGEPQVRAARLATALARTLYYQLTGKQYADSVSASAHLADEMLYCFLQSQACPLLTVADLASSNDLPTPRPAPLYVGVSAWANAPARYIAHLLAILTGEQLPVNSTECNALHKQDDHTPGTNPDFEMTLDPEWHPAPLALQVALATARSVEGFSFYYLKGWNHTGVCLRTTLNFTQAISPAFSIPGYNMSSGQYSTWTESVWHEMWARVFVTASGEGARAAWAAGALATLAATVLTYWLQRHSAIVFATPSNTIVNDATTGILRSVNC